MKQERHHVIRELIATAPIQNQDELRRKLVRRGFAVTQATLSRDIHEMRLYKGPNGYSLPNGDGSGGDGGEETPAIGDVVSTFGLRARQALNQVVIQTTMGGAQPVAAAIDEQQWPAVIGTIAGDDTVLVICPDQKRAAQFRTLIEEMIGQ